MNPAWGNRFHTSLRVTCCGWAACQKTSNSLESTLIVCPCWDKCFIPKKQLKLQTPHTGGLPISAFCNSRAYFFLGGNSFQKWLDAECVVASGCPLAEMKSEVSRQNRFWLSSTPLNMPCYALETPSESWGPPLTSGRVFFHWSHLSACPGSQGQ